LHTESMQLETKQNLPAIHKRKMINKVLYMHSAMKAHKDNAKICYFSWGYCRYMLCSF